MPELVMPRLSDSMEEGTIVRWLKSDGDVVSKGEPIAEIETDKATVTCDADADGTLRIVAGEGATVPLGGVIATIGEASEPRSGSPAPAQPRLRRAGPRRRGQIIRHRQRSRPGEGVAARPPDRARIAGRPAGADRVGPGRADREG